MAQKLKCRSQIRPGVVHLTGGVAGLAGTIVLGPRKGRFTNPEEFETHNLPLVVLLGFRVLLGCFVGIRMI